MSELEERGYLASPHTSSGRVPTAQGYRFFVDTLLQIGPVEQGAVMALNAGLDPNRSSTELVQTASNLLARITYQTGIVTVPKPAGHQLGAMASLEENQAPTWGFLLTFGVFCDEVTFQEISKYPGAGLAFSVGTYSWMIQATRCRNFI